MLRGFIMKKLIFPLSSLSFVFLMSACTVENTEQIVENAVAAQENLESYYAEVTTSYVFDEEEEKLNYKQWFVKPDQHRTEMDDDHTYVSNGEMSWSYNKENHTVMINDSIGDVELADKTLDESDMIRKMLTEMMESNNVVANGKQIVADRSTFHLSLTPKEAKGYSKDSSNYEIWIDEETYLPLKIVWEDDSIRSETIYHHIEYNIDINEDMFTFEIPEDAKIQSIDGYLTLEELENATEYDLPDMSSIPEKYQFQDAVQFGYESVIHFKNDSGEYLDLSIISDIEYPLHEDQNSDNVEVGRYKGAYSNNSIMQFLTWDTGQFKIEMTTSEDELSKEELIKIAEGIR